MNILTGVSNTISIPLWKEFVTVMNILLFGIKIDLFAIARKNYLFKKKIHVMI